MVRFIVIQDLNDGEKGQTSGILSENYGTLKNAFKRDY